MKYFSFKFTKELVDSYYYNKTILETAFTKEEISSFTKREEKIVKLLIKPIYYSMVLVMWIYLNIKQPR